MRVQFTVRCWPKGGGMVMNVGTVADLSEEALAKYPRGSWKRIRAAKQAGTPADKQVTGSATK